MTAGGFDEEAGAGERSAVIEPVPLSTVNDQRLVADQRSIVDWLSTADDVEFSAQQLNLSLRRPDL